MTHQQKHHPRISCSIILVNVFLVSSISYAIAHPQEGSSSQHTNGTERAGLLNFPRNLPKPNWRQQLVCKSLKDPITAAPNLPRYMGKMKFVQGSEFSNTPGGRTVVYSFQAGETKQAVSTWYSGALASYGWKLDQRHTADKIVAQSNDGKTTCIVRVADYGLPARLAVSTVEKGKTSDAGMTTLVTVYLREVHCSLN